MTEGTDDLEDPARQVPLTFEAARDQLELIVRQLEDGNVTLQESVEMWERGERLAAHCDELLGQVERRLEAAKAQMDEPT
jgi:exodeoxyribonuclease VII small subunit